MRVQEDIYYYPFNEPKSRFFGRGGAANVYAVNQKDEVWLIDSGNSRFFRVPRLLGAMKADGLDVSLITKVFITHAHPDHVEGLPALIKRFPNIRIYVHQAEASILSGGWNYFWKQQEKACFGLESEVFPGPLALVKYQAAKKYGTIPAVKNIEVLKNGDKIRGRRHTIQCIHAPGHSPGHSCYLIPERSILFSGDLVHPDRGYKPTINIPSADFDQYRRTLKFLSKQKFDMLLTSHGVDPVPNPIKVTEAFKTGLEKLDLVWSIVVERLKDGDGMRLKEFRGAFAEHIWSKYEQQLMPFVIIKSLRKNEKVRIQDGRFYYN
jgi:glyoxylase-like metal-dependent hydrolase (beta-lactamase superfamily II)